MEGVIDASKIIPCRCVASDWEERRKKVMLKLCQLPPMADKMSIDNFRVFPELQEAYEVAKQALDVEQLLWITFMGGNDTGKTHLALSICKVWLDKGIPAKYAYVPLLLDELRAGFRADNEAGFDERFKWYRNVPLLILDDLGKENRTPWANEKLEELIDYRLMNNKSLVVTTEKTMEEMPAGLGSRLVRHPNAKLVAITAGEYTLRDKKSKS